MVAFVLNSPVMEAAPPWGPGPPASAAPQEEASGVLGPRPLSAQARSLLDPHTHTSYHSSGFGPTHDQSTDPPFPAGRPLFQQSWGLVLLVYNYFLVPGGDHIVDSRVCVSYSTIYRSNSLAWGGQRSEISLPRAPDENPIFRR